jgi:hypothetical protein
MLEFHADNLSPWVLLDDAHTAQDDGWDIRANRLLAHWSRRREAFAEQGIAVPEVVVSPVGAGGTRSRRTSRSETGPGLGATAFAAAARAICDALPPPMRGLVLLIAPAVVEGDEAFAADISALVDAPDLAGCRWVVVVDSDRPRPALLTAMGERAIDCECTIDPAKRDEDLDALLADGGGADDAGRMTASPRGVVPPRRVDDPPQLAEEQRDTVLRAAGIAPAMLDEGPRLRNLVLGAAVAMK